MQHSLDNSSLENFRTGSWHILGMLPASEIDSGMKYTYSQLTDYIIIPNSLPTSSDEHATLGLVATHLIFVVGMKKTIYPKHELILVTTASWI